MVSASEFAELTVGSGSRRLEPFLGPVVGMAWTHVAKKNGQLCNETKGSRHLYDTNIMLCIDIIEIYNLEYCGLSSIVVCFSPDVYSLCQLIRSLHFQTCWNGRPYICSLKPSNVVESCRIMLLTSLSHYHHYTQLFGVILPVKAIIKAIITIIIPSLKPSLILPVFVFVSW